MCIRDSTKAFLQEQLAALVAQARSTRQPIPDGELAALCLEPVDLLDSRRSRNRPSPRWYEPDEGETVQLDPEGLSLIVFEYASATAHSIFHLPLRVAEGFLPEPLIRDLKGRPGDSRECGEFIGRTITEAESQEYPLGDILRELGVDVAAVCPYRLAEKQAYISRLDEQRHKGERLSGTCPLCGDAVEAGPLTRIAHWRQNHHDQDLTASQVAWLLGMSKTEVKSPSAAIQPDYRGPSSSQPGNGTRFWRLETVETAVRRGHGCVGES